MTVGDVCSIANDERARYGDAIGLSKLKRSSANRSHATIPITPGPRHDNFSRARFGKIASTVDPTINGKKIVGCQGLYPGVARQSDTPAPGAGTERAYCAV